MGLRHQFVISGPSDPALPVDEVDWNAEHVLDDFIDFPSLAMPVAPAAGIVRKFNRSDRAGGAWPAFRLSDGTDFDIPWNEVRDQLSMVVPNFGSNSISTIGAATTVAGTLTARAVADTDALTRSPGVEYRITTAAATAIASLRFNVGRFLIGGSAAGRGGFRSYMLGSATTGANTATHRFFMGFWGNGGPTDVNPSTLTTIFGIGYDAADSNLQFMHNDATGSCTKIDLGASFPKPTAASSSLWELEMYSPPGTTRLLQYRVVNRFTGAVASGTVTTDLPAVSAYLQPHIWASVGGTSSVIGINIGKMAAFDLGRA